LLLVLRAPNYGTLERSKSLECLCGGAEGNVVAGLSSLGLTTAYISRVRDNFIGRTLVDELSSHRVDTEGILFCQKGRMGILFIELGVPPRPNMNVYDREGATILNLLPEDVNWDLFRRAHHFYFSGITAALGEDCRRVLVRAVEEAKAVGMKVFFDLNFRSKLWSYEQARTFLETVAPRIDVFFIRQEDARPMFDMEDKPGEIASSLRQQFGFEAVVLTLGGEGAVVALSTKILSREAVPTQFLNRIGVGDSFVAGFIYGYTQMNVESALTYGTAMAALKATIPNENRPIISRHQVEKVIASMNEASRGRKGSSDVER
jgi:2-dehydro-3-deoxygluconokinase